MTNDIMTPYWNLLHSKTDAELIEMVKAHAQNIKAYTNLFGNDAQSLIEGEHRGMANIYSLVHYHRQYLEQQIVAVMK